MVKVLKCFVNYLSWGSHIHFSQKKNIIEGSLEVKLPTLWTVGKAEVGRVRKEKKRSGKIREERRCRRAEKVGKSRFTMFVPMICGSGGSKSRLAKAAGAEPAGQMRGEKICTPLWREAFLEVKKCQKAPHCLGPLLEVEMSKKCTPVVARSTFPSQNVQNTPTSDHFWKLRNSADHCGAKMREAHFQVKSAKN